MNSSSDYYRKHVTAKQRMDSSKDLHLVRKLSSSTNSSVCAFLFGFLLIVSFFYLFVSNSVVGFKPFSVHQCSCPQFNASNVGIAKNNGQKRGKLDVALQEASTPNKTLIIAIVNKAYAEEVGDQKPMLDLFLDSFWVGQNTRPLLDHLLLVSMDRYSYARCKFLRLHCYKLRTRGVDFNGEKIYMSDDFIKMMWARTLFLRDVLKRGYNFVFTDTDVMWLRNPFPRLLENQNVDLQISTDKFNGNERSTANRINTGFYMIRSNNKTISLFDSWYSRKDKSIGQKEQDVLQAMLHSGVFAEIGVKVRFLDTKYFSGFCQQSKDVKTVTTVHANCCRTISAKVVDLTAVLRCWKDFKTSNSSVNRSSGFAKLKHEKCIDSWKKI